MSKKTSTKRKSPLRSQKASPTFCVDRFARKLANCNTTSYAGRYTRNSSSVSNPALCADNYRHNVDDFRHDYLLYNVKRKFNGSDNMNADKRRKAAFSKFKSVDDGLQDINRDLNWTNLGLQNPVAQRILFCAARKIERLLGELDISDVSTSASFSHGATMLHTRKEGRAPFKYSFEYPEVTAECAKLAWALVKESPCWSETVKGLTLVAGNRLTTVPKDSDIDRVIACEPTMNMFIQKGIGDVLRWKLKSVGINLDDQSKNQQLAKAGSTDGAQATIDLSAASDSISLAICRLLLPHEWYHLLLETRSDVGVLPDGEQVCYNKISSMGNGFTFELESMLFWAITQACEDEVSRSYGDKTYRCSVYGDDIICRIKTVSILKHVLELCGFKLNDEKSFSQGPFRESCGKHYFNGIDVTPFFVRGPIISTLDLIGLCNRLRRWSRSCLGIDDPRYVDLYKWCVSYLPPFWQVAYIPDGLGDGALYGYLDEVKPGFSKSGVYKAPVLLVKERTVNEKQRRYDPLSQVFFGRGGYTAALRDLDAKSRFEGAPDLKQVRGNDEDILQRLCGNAQARSVLTEPGDLIVQKKHICITEWSDSLCESLVA